MPYWNIKTRFIDSRAGFIPYSFTIHFHCSLVNIFNVLVPITACLLSCSLESLANIFCRMCSTVRQSKAFWLRENWEIHIFFGVFSIRWGKQKTSLSWPINFCLDGRIWTHLRHEAVWQLLPQQWRANFQQFFSITVHSTLPFTILLNTHLRSVLASWRSRPA